MEKMISGIKPTGKITLGNYLGAIKPFISYQDKYDLSVFIADLHALTLPINPLELKENSINLLAIYLASGLDPKKVTIFKQSDISAHTQLEWVLTCNTVLNELTKMPQYKNFLEKNNNKPTPTGMLMYPSLMSADCLLYDSEVIPVGEDQLSHIYLTRDVAAKFNKVYGETFVCPKPIVQKVGAKIMSLSDPTKKMSKSESDKGTIYLLEDVAIARKKIMKATTDSENIVKYDVVNKPGVSNLMTIYSCLTNMSFDDIEAKYNGLGYGDFKRDLADIVCNELTEIQHKVDMLKEEDDFLESVLFEGFLKMSVKANAKINEVYKKIGLR